MGDRRDRRALKGLYFSPDFIYFGVFHSLHPFKNRRRAFPAFCLHNGNIISLSNCKNMGPLQPIEKQNRLPVIDSLRGLALLGILVANIPFANYEHVSASRDVSDFQGSDNVLSFLFHLLIEKKFITIFSMLFGFGFYVQLKRAEERGIDFKSYFLKRMTILLLIGCVHAYIFWFGDIIRDYAICGMFLLFVYKWKPGKLLPAAIVFSVFLTGSVFIANGVFNLQEYAYDTAIAAEHPQATSYWRYLYINARIDPFVNFVQDSPITLVFCFGNMLTGFWMAKSGFFHQQEKFGSVRKKLIMAGIFLGIPASYLLWLINMGKIELSPALIWLPYVIVGGMVLQSLSYIAAFIQLFRLEAWRKILSLFATVGKMALTNYLLQTVFYLLFFFHWTNGLKLYGRLTITETYLVALGLFLVQVVFSTWWMKKHEQGPVENIWKRLSYKFTGSNVALQAN